MSDRLLGVRITRKDDPILKYEWGVWEVQLDTKNKDVIGEIHYYSHPYPVYYPVGEGVDLWAMKRILKAWEELKNDNKGN